MGGVGDAVRTMTKAGVEVELDWMRASDIAAVARIEHATFGPTRGDGEAPGTAALAEELARPWSKLWVARTAEPIAYVSAWHVVDELHILNVATRTSERRTGIARALLDHVLAWSRDAGVRLVLLEVRRSNAPAIALYASLGFATFGERRGYYDDGEDAVEMRLELG